MKIKEFEIREQGKQNAQYYQGAGTSFTDWDHVAVGIGDSYSEALEDALDQLACSDYDIDDIENEYTDDNENTVCQGCEHATEDGCSDEITSCEMHIYVEVYVKDVDVSEVQTHNDGGCGGPYYPSINVKSYNWPFAAIEKRFWNSLEEDIERASRFAFEGAQERFWEDAQELAEHHFKYHSVKVYSAGRSGGNLIVQGVGHPSDWDQEDLEQWEAFEQGIIENMTAYCNVDSIIDDIEANRWNEPRSARYNFIETDKGNFCISDIETDVAEYKENKYGA